VKRPLRPEERILWGVVTATVQPAATRRPAPVEGEVENRPLISAPIGKAPPKFVKPSKVQPPVQAVAPKPKPKASPAAPGAIEPRRKHRIVKERDDLGARIDLHGLDQDAARAALHGFLLRAQAEGIRAVLVITGKGNLGDGILRKRTPDWLSEPVVRHAVAGVSEAARHHGGAGALYVALKRKV
jgi:DNA-nicking Smr family endonuclease